MNAKAITAALGLAIGIACGSAVAQPQPVHTNVIYINGIQNTLEDAQATQQRMQEILNSSPNHTGADHRVFVVDLIWNPTGWYGTTSFIASELSQEKQELFLLKVAEEKFASSFRKIIAPFNKFSTIDTGAATEVVKFLDDMTPGSNFLEDLGLMKYEGTPHFPVTASSAKIGLWKSI